MSKRTDCISDRVAVGIGEVLWDMLPGGKKVGGAPTNFAFHVSQFGIPSVAVSAIGEDRSGVELAESLASAGVTSLLTEVPYPTGIVRVELDEAGIPVYEITRNVAWDHIPFTPELKALAKQTCAVCFGSLAQREPTSRSTIHAFLDAMPSGPEILKVFDINLRQDFYSTEVIDASLRRCNIFKLNDDELVVLAREYGLPTDSPESACTKLREMYGLRIVILTCGSKGSYVFADGTTSYITTPQVEVADTVGAGDSFTASFIASLLKHLTLPEAHRVAVDVAAYVCSNTGATPQLPANLLAALD